MTGVEDEVKAFLTVGIYTNKHYERLVLLRYVLDGARHTHKTLIGYSSVAFQMEQHSHVILVVGSVEACYIDGRRSLAVSEVLGIKSWFPAVGQVDLVPITVRSGDPFYAGFGGSSDDGGEERE